MSDYTKQIMAQIAQRIELAGMSLQDFGERMGYKPGAARKSAWQFLNATEDPRLSMIEKAATALGVSVIDLLKPFVLPSLVPGQLQPEIAEEVAVHYRQAAVAVMRGRWNRDDAIRAITRGTDAALSGQPAEVKKQWDKWRIRTGQLLHTNPKSAEEYSAALHAVADELTRLARNERHN